MSGVPWIQRFLTSAISLHPKVFVPCGSSLYLKDSFPGSRDLLSPSAFSLHPKIDNIWWSVSRKRFLYPKDSLDQEFPVSEIRITRCSLNPGLNIQSFVTSGLWSSFNQGFTMAMCLLLKNFRGGCRARVLETRLIYQVDIHSGCQTSGGRSARAARRRLLSRH